VGVAVAVAVAVGATVAVAVAVGVAVAVAVAEGVAVAVAVAVGATVAVAVAVAVAVGATVAVAVAVGATVAVAVAVAVGLAVAVGVGVADDAGPSAITIGDNVGKLPQTVFCAKSLPVVRSTRTPPSRCNKLNVPNAAESVMYGTLTQTLIGGDTLAVVVTSKAGPTKL
jgi:hypothetical protein